MRVDISKAKDFVGCAIKKRKVVFLTCGLLLLAVNSFGISSAAASKSLVTLSLWTHQRHMADLTKELINRFNVTVGREKGIKIVMRILGDDSWPMFQEALKNGEGPDLYSSGYRTGYPDPFKAGAQIWFDEFPDFEQWKRQWPSWYWVEGMSTYQGHVFSIPAQVFNSRLIYNRDLFRAAGLDPDHPPRSYRELRYAAKRISRYGHGRYYGFAYCGAESWPMEWLPSQWAEANGDPAYWDWKSGRWALKGYSRVFQLLLDLKQDGSLFPGTAILTNEALRAQFAEGRVGMFMDEFWDVGVLNAQFPAKCDWGVAPIPTYDGQFHGKPRAMVIGGMWNINGQSRHKFEAWEVVKWFNRYQVRAIMYERGKCIDPDSRVVKEYVKHKPNVRGFEGFAGTLDRDYIATYPILPGWKAPTANPCTVFRNILIRGGDLNNELIKLDYLWNRRLDHYYQQNPDIKRGWNIYPKFNRFTGSLGDSLVKPHFAGAGK
jgi:multiple sugar transport system substrate-binding protein